jgi:6-phosphogluconolactonase
VLGDLQIVDDVPAAFTALVVEEFRSRPDDEFSIALSGGETARRCYARLAADAAEAIDWWKVDVYWGDERCVPPDSPESNERLVRETLLEQVGAANAVYPMRCEDGPDSYQLHIGELGKFDVVHLGLGADGHTASLFPQSTALDADDGRFVVMNDDPTGLNPHTRMTLTFAGIERSRLIVVTVEGEEKREAMEKVARDADVPAARIRGDRVVWLCDRAAAPTS